MRELHREDAVDTIASTMPAGITFRVHDALTWNARDIATFVVDRLEDGHYALVYTGPGD